MFSPYSNYIYVNTFNNTYSFCCRDKFSYPFKEFSFKKKKCECLIKNIDFICDKKQYKEEINIVLFFNTACNFKCVFCFNHKYKKYSLNKEIIIFLKRFKKIDNFHWGDGEYFFDNNHRGLINYLCKTFNSKLELMTNFSFYDKNKIIIPLSKIYYSNYGYNNDEYLKNTGTKNADICFNNFVKYNKFDRKDEKVFLSFMINKYTINNLYKNIEKYKNELFNFDIKYNLFDCLNHENLYNEEDKKKNEEIIKKCFKLIKT